MRVAVTGTPGTGKTTATELVETDLEVVHLNDAIREEELHDGADEERGSLYANFDAIRQWLDEQGDGGDDLLVDSHLAHHFDAEKVVVLRCHPEELRERLLERGETDAKAEENAESEALDVILSESVAEHGTESVYEIDTTDRAPDAVASDIEAVIEGEREPSAGTVDYLEYL
ncbi:nucleotide kinase [Haladaptatus paucihalophilus DX253]|uniref:Putative adenylate kinase n=1 Tax=Haladaptatus paucihalophilus DX253 TaxID=797209 RepID=E7QSU6_HALPU|nr:AAA family ATPase [Haladaptatus paucihalophilus]EFW92505.1 nucleotide kinase [Haladaptatus paucihalophilus DX253]SHK08168.1 adenylate kinase [Haladaptatus paucihalophilus DX253]